MVPNAAIAIILSPLAIIIAQHFQSIDPLIDPTKAFLMAICFGASTSFMTPMGYQTNLMVFAPGQYKFKDFLIAGFPITIVFWIMSSYLIPVCASSVDSHPHSLVFFLQCSRHFGDIILAV